MVIHASSKNRFEDVELPAKLLDYLSNRYPSLPIQILYLIGSEGSLAPYSNTISIQQVSLAPYSNTISNRERGIPHTGLSPSLTK